MTKCQMKIGFFYLRECNKSAQGTCSICGRQFCNEHIRMMSGQNQLICLDCLGKQMQTTQPKYYHDYYYDSAWCYGYRHQYYNDTNYSPWYDGHGFMDSYYSSLDVRSFDNKDLEESDDVPDEEYDDGNVFDS